MANLSLDILTNDSFFVNKPGPGHILGQPKTANRFGKSVTVISGTLDDAIQRIEQFLEDAPEPVQYELNPAQQREKKPNYDAGNLRKAVENTENYVYPSTKGTDILDVDATLRKFQPEITTDDLQLWVFYQRGRLFDNEIIKNNALGKYILSYKEEQKKKKEWIKNGKLCYNGIMYVPHYIYYSGNIYQKVDYLKNHREKIIEEIGEKNYNRQLNNLEASKPIQLVLHSTEGNDLHVSPLDKFAQQFTITETAGGDIFESPLSLLGAYKYYLTQLERNEFKNGSDPNEIEKHFLKGKAVRSPDMNKARKAKIKRRSKQDGVLLFNKFLRENLTRQDQQRLELDWNKQFNAFAEMDYAKIPVTLEMNKWFKEAELIPTPIQWSGVKFQSKNGVGINSFDVGVGKTITTILVLAQALYTGQAKRPVIIVPNQTYLKWIHEIIGEFDKDGNVISHGVLPHFKNRINDYYNAGVHYISHIEKNPPRDYTITFLAYSGFEQLGFSPDYINNLGSQLYEILSQGEAERDKEKLKEKIEKMMGKTVENTTLQFDKMGFDYLVVDEGHNFKKVFTKVKSEEEKGNNPYKITNGDPSKRALKLFAAAQHILYNNSMRNVMLLTAIPFTNSPLEIYSMLSLVAYQELERRGIQNIKQFFDKFANEETEISVKQDNTIQEEAVLKAFNNKILLQNIIFDYVNHKTGEEANITRPEKVVYPLLKDEDGTPLPHDQQVDTSLQKTSIQEYWSKEIANFSNYNPVTGEGTYSEIEKYVPANMYDEETGRLPGRILMAINMQRSLNMSPYLFNVAGTYIVSDKIPTPEEYVESSPKIKYVTQCIGTTMQWHDSRNEKYSGQVIYMDVGVDYFYLIKEYIVKIFNINENRIATLVGNMDLDKKAKIMNKFASGEIFIIIGSSTMKEGIDLQSRTTVLYNCNIDWNPTDVQQIEGRAWRQGNQHSHVRIVIPMIENSVDVFMFQKLGEKTARLNDIWNTNKKGNVLKLAEFNPEELKFGLLTEPGQIAGMMINEESEKLSMEMDSVSNILKQLSSLNEDLINYRKREAKLNSIYKENALPELRMLRNDLQNQIDNNKKASKENKLKKTQLDKLTRRLEKINNVLAEPEKGDERKHFYRVLKTYMQEFRDRMIIHDYTELKLKIEAQRGFDKKSEKLQKLYLDKYGLTIDDDITPVIKEHQDNFNDLQEKYNKVNSEEYFQEKLQEIQKKREEQQKFSKPLETRVKEFTKHNHLLSCLRDVHACKLCPKKVVEKTETPENITESKPWDKPGAQLKQKNKQYTESKTDDIAEIEENIRQLQTLKDAVPEEDKAEVEENIRQLQTLKEVTQQSEASQSESTDIEDAEVISSTEQTEQTGDETATDIQKIEENIRQLQTLKDAVPEEDKAEVAENIRQLQTLKEVTQESGESGKKKEAEQKSESEHVTNKAYSEIENRYPEFAPKFMDYLRERVKGIKKYNESDLVYVNSNKKQIIVRLGDKRFLICQDSVVKKGEAPTAIHQIKNKDNYTVQLNCQEGKNLKLVGYPNSEKIKTPESSPKQESKKTPKFNIGQIVLRGLILHTIIHIDSKKNENNEMQYFYTIKELRSGETEADVLESQLEEPESSAVYSNYVIESIAIYLFNNNYKELKENPYRTVKRFLSGNPQYQSWFNAQVEVKNKMEIPELYDKLLKILKSITVWDILIEINKKDSDIGPKFREDDIVNWDDAGKYKIESLYSYDDQSGYQYLIRPESGGQRKKVSEKDLWVKSKQEKDTGEKSKEEKPESHQDTTWENIPDIFKKIPDIKELDFKFKPGDKNLKKLLKPFPSTDELRPQLNGMYFNSEHIVATDAHKIVAVPYGSQKPQDKYIHKIYYPNGNIVDIDNPYPNWKSVIKFNIENSYAVHLPTLLAYNEVAKHFVSENELVRYRIKDYQLGLKRSFVTEIATFFMQLGYETIYLHIDIIARDKNPTTGEYLNSGSITNPVFYPSPDLPKSKSTLQLPLALLMPMALSDAGGEVITWDNNQAGVTNLDYERYLYAYFDFSQNAIISQGKEYHYDKGKQDTKEQANLNEGQLKAIGAYITNKQTPIKNIPQLEYAYVKNNMLHATDTESAIIISNAGLDDGFYRYAKPGLLPANSEIDTSPFNYEYKCNTYIGETSVEEFVENLETNIYFTPPPKRDTIDSAGFLFRILFDFGKESFYMISTDEVVMAMNYNSLDMGSGAKEISIADNKNLKNLVALLKARATLNPSLYMYIDKKQANIRFNSGNTNVYCKIQSFNHDEGINLFKPIMDINYTTSFVLDTKELKDMLKGSKKQLEEKKITFDVKQSQVDLEIPGESQKTYKIKRKDYNVQPMENRKDFKAGFYIIAPDREANNFKLSAYHVKKILQSISSENVIIFYESTGSEKPGIIKIIGESLQTKLQKIDADTGEKLPERQKQPAAKSKK